MQSFAAMQHCEQSTKKYGDPAFAGSTGKNQTNDFRAHETLARRQIYRVVY